jgi:hypothetical protein
MCSEPLSEVLYFLRFTLLSHGDSILTKAKKQKAKKQKTKKKLDGLYLNVYRIKYAETKAPRNPLLEPPPPCNNPLPLNKAFSLQLITRKLLFESKVSLLFIYLRYVCSNLFQMTINTRIVVIGASTAGLSFIDTLLKTAYLNLRNIILVNPGGMPDPKSLFEPIAGTSHV